MDVLYNFEASVIKFDNYYKVLHLSWDDFPLAEAFDEVVRELIRLSQELKAEAWLIDASQSLNLDEEELAVKARHFEEILRQTPVRKIARVISSNIFYEARLNSLKQQSQTQIAFRFFNSEQAALAWLQA
ncbi:MAG TPA: hypothetical protein VK927_09410 [Adhaeribacter sp.]|nr:hypothetical protein [Adhaeribacter sp.]